MDARLRAMVENADKNQVITDKMIIDTFSYNRLMYKTPNGFGYDLYDIPLEWLLNDNISISLKEIIFESKFIY